MADYTLLGSYFNLSGREIKILEFLIKHGEINARELATGTNIEIARVYEALKHLEGNELIIKEGDWAATYKVNPTLPLKLRRVIDEQEKNRINHQREVQCLLNELNKFLVIKNEEYEFPYTVPPPFYRVFNLNDPSDLGDYYALSIQNTELNIIMTPFHFLQSMQRLFHFKSVTSRDIVNEAKNVKTARYIILGEIKDNIINKFAKVAFPNNIEVERTVEIKRAFFNELPLIFSFTSEYIFFPVMRPDGAVTSIISSKDLNFMDPYRAYFWDKWNNLPLLMKIEQGKVLTTSTTSKIWKNVSDMLRQLAKITPPEL
ncbi:MAG: helix-turn-helix domain-containing protein [Candidatus Hodarchaeales archaeon]